MKLPPRRKAVLTAFKKIERKTGSTASLSQVSDACGVTIATVHEHVFNLLSLGLMNKTRCGGVKGGKSYYKYHSKQICPTCGHKL